MSAARASVGFAGRMTPDGTSEAMAQLDRLADMLDTKWRMPGTNFRFGVDAVAGLVPGVGDLATGLISAYMVKRAYDLGAPKHVLARMVGNVALDTVVGSVPILGSIFDFAFKANRRNMKLLRAHFDARR
jgi:hypothetical protein